MPGEQRLDAPGRQRPVQQPAGGEPDRDRAPRWPARCALGGLLDGLLQHASGPARRRGRRRRRPAAVADPQELGGGEQDALGGAPAGLRRDRGDPAAGQLHHGLVQQRELAVVQGGAQPRGELGAARRPRPASAARTARPGPCRPALARYIARSALRIRSPGLMPGSAKATPMLAATRTSLPSMRYGCGEGRCAAGRRSRGCGTRGRRGRGCRRRGSARRTRRRRAGPRCRPARTESWSLRAAWTSSSSPAWWPMRVVDRLEAVEVDEEHGGAAVAGAAAGERPGGRAR